MAKYINADHLIEIFKKMEKQSDIFDHGTILAAIAAIEVFPAEEVASEIFEEIADVLNELGYFDELDFYSLKKKYTEVQDGTRTDH